MCMQCATHYPSADPKVKNVCSYAKCVDLLILKHVQTHLFFLLDVTYVTYCPFHKDQVSFLSCYWYNRLTLRTRYSQPTPDIFCTSIPPPLQPFLIHLSVCSYAKCVCVCVCVLIFKHVQTHLCSLFYVTYVTYWPSYITVCLIRFQYYFSRATDTTVSQCGPRYSLPTPGISISPPPPYFLIHLSHTHY
jgi:hypothetical protein